MRIVAVALALFIACIARASAAPEPEPTATPSIQLETGANWANLTNGYGEWHNVYATAERKAGRRDLYATFTSATRNGVTDPGYLAGAVFPASSQTILSLEGSFSFTHQFLPVTTLSASLDHRLANGYGYQVGSRHVAYPSLAADIESFGADRYFGHFRAAYLASFVTLSDVAGLAVDHRLTFTRYYGPNDQNSATFVLSGGRDVENVNGIVAVYPLLEIDLAGRHWFDRHFGLVYDLFTLRQGLLYHQTGIQVGIRHRS